MDCDCEHEGEGSKEETPGHEECPETPPQLDDRATIIPILEKRTFDFSSLAPTGALPSDVNVVLCPARFVFGYYRVRLAVRIHSLTISTGQSIQFLLYGALPSEEDPAQEFVDSSSAFLTLTIDNTNTAPSLVTATATDPDAYLRIVLRGIQGGGSAPLIGQLSASLVLRSF